MGLRCFARRALVPPRQRQLLAWPAFTYAPPSSAISSSARGKQKAKDESQVEEQDWTSERSGSGFFSAKSLLKASGGSLSPKSAIGSTMLPELAANDPNFLYNELLHQLRQSPEQRSPERVWELYTALHDVDEAGAPSEHAARSPSLLGIHHQQVLHAIAGSPRGSLEGLAELKHFIQRTWYIFGQMRRLKVDARMSNFFVRRFDSDHDEGSLPSTSDYNFVLSKAASEGEFMPMLTIWQEMQARSVAPNTRTFEWMLRGLFRHTDKQLASISVEHVSLSESSPSAQRNTLAVVRFRGARNSLQAQAKAKQLAPGFQDGHMKGRRAATLAAQRCVGLLRTMQAQKVSPSTQTIDMAARIFRLAGDLPALKRMLRDFFAIDLANPDAVREEEEAVKTKPSIHTLNTIVMALGEKASVSEMISAYETISMPLPEKRAVGGWEEEDDMFGESVKGAIEPSAGSSAGGLFKLDWSALSREADEAQAPPYHITEQAFTYSSPRQILPNNKTFTTMIRHCFRPLDASQAAASFAQYERGTGTSLRAAESRAHQRFMLENRKRANGDFLLIAQSLLREVLVLFEGATNELEKRMSALGHAASLHPADVQQHLLPSADYLGPVVNFASTRKSSPLARWAEAYCKSSQKALRKQTRILERARERFASSVEHSALCEAISSQLEFNASAHEQFSLLVESRIRPRLQSLVERRKRQALKRSDKQLHAEAKQRWEEEAAERSKVEKARTKAAARAEREAGAIEPVQLSPA